MFSRWVLKDVGYTELLLCAVDDGPSQQVTIDPVLACALLLGFLHQDAVRRGVLFWPWALATLPLGSIAPLVYLTYTGWRRVPSDVTQPKAKENTFHPGPAWRMLMTNDPLPPHNHRGIRTSRGV